MTTVLNVSLTRRTVPTYSFLFSRQLYLYSLCSIPLQLLGAFGVSCEPFFKCRIKTFKSLVKRHNLQIYSPSDEVPALSLPENSPSLSSDLSQIEKSLGLECFCEILILLRQREKELTPLGDICFYCCCNSCYSLKHHCPFAHRC